MIALTETWIDHPSTMNPGMQYFIHRKKKHVVAFDKTKGKQPWVIRMRNGKQFQITYAKAQDAIDVASGMA